MLTCTLNGATGGGGGGVIPCFINTHTHLEAGVPGQCYSLFSLEGLQKRLGEGKVLAVTQSPAASVQSLDLVYASPLSSFPLLTYPPPPLFPFLLLLLLISSHFCFPLKHPGAHFLFAHLNQRQLNLCTR